MARFMIYIQRIQGLLRVSGPLTIIMQDIIMTIMIVVLWGREEGSSVDNIHWW